jgi:RNA polymerase sigma-70 factor, ECF subfamily
LDRQRENKLVQQAQEGDTEAFAELVLEHQRFAFNLALRALGDPQEAEDIIQEAFLKAWQALPRFRRQSKFQTWLYRIVMNLCYNRLPRLKADMDQADEASIDFLVAPKPTQNPSSAFDMDELQEFLHRQIDHLPESHRLLISLRYQQNLSYAEIAEIVDTPLGTVKTGIFRARQRLRTALQQFEESPV